MLYFKCCAMSFIVHIESRGRNNVKSLNKIAINPPNNQLHFFSYTLNLFIKYLYQAVSFQKLFKILQNGDLVTTALF